MTGSTTHTTMPRNHIAGFKKSTLALCILAATSAQAQQTNISEEEVIVTGIRASLERAMDIKRENYGVVDAISAEDIGKFPDTNLAESLQRITGVSINRDNGEGQEVTVRGFGPSNNMVTLNGRQMPTARANPDSASDTRAFDFSDIASEGVSGVQVYKTGRASVATGGIGASINITTLKPLDQPGMRASVGVKAVNDTTNREGDDITPELSALFSQTFMDDKIGVSFVGSYQERDSGTAGINHQDWRTQAFDSAAPIFNGATIVNAPDEGQLWSQPRNLIYQLDDIERKRTNAQLTLQFRPVESLTATLDYTYSEQETSLVRHEQSIWFQGGLDRIEFDNNTVRTPIIYSESFNVDATNPGADLSFATIVQSTLNENESVGLNLEWDVSDSFTLTFDAHDSSAEAGPEDQILGTNSKFSTAAFAVSNQTINYGREIPTLDVTLDDTFSSQTETNGVGTFGVEDISSTRGNADYSDNATDIQQIQIGGSWDFDDGSIDFGIERREMENVARLAQISPVFGDWGGTDPALLPDELFREENFASELGGGFAGGYVFDFQAAADWAAERFNATNPNNDASQPFRDFNNGIFSTDREFEVNRKIEEATTGAFIQVNVEAELAGRPANIVAGVRYETTDVDATSAIQLPSLIRWEDNDDFLIVQSSDLQAFSRSGSYSNVLPSIDFDIEIVDDVKARASFSETIARPVYSNLRAGVGSFDFNAGASPTANAGNPGLSPLESQNLDFSLEWYYDETSYVSAGYYRKEVDNFVGTSIVNQPQFGLRDPRLGERGAQAAADLGFPDATTAYATDPSGFFNRVLTNAGLDPADQTTFIDADGTDPLVQWATSTPTNANTAKIFGFEFAIQHLFGDSGFGVIANYTTVNGDVEYDINATPGTTQFALVGLSDTANLVGFYENNGLQVRVSYNWRDEFLDSTSAGGLQEPSFTEEFAQVDVNVSYAINDNLNVFLEGINVNEENTRQHGRTKNQILQYNELGARYQLGARYTF